MRGIHRWPVDSPHKRPITRKPLPCDNLLMRVRTLERVSHNDCVIMTTIASQITSLTVVYSIVYSDADQRKHQISVSLAFVRGIRIPRTNGQLRGKCFHLMTSSCWIEIIAKLCFAKNNSGFIPRKQTHLCKSYLSKISHSLQRRLKPVHWNGNLVMLTKFSSMATQNVVIW